MARRDCIVKHRASTRQKRPINLNCKPRCPRLKLTRFISRVHMHFQVEKKRSLLMDYLSTEKTIDCSPILYPESLIIKFNSFALDLCTSSNKIQVYPKLKNYFLFFLSVLAHNRYSNRCQMLRSGRLIGSNNKMTHLHR